MELVGITSSGGIAWGPVMVLETPLSAGVASSLEIDPRREVLNFHEALDHSRRELRLLQEDVGRRLGEKESAIFEAQELILDDPMLTDEVIRRIMEDRTGAVEALAQVMDSLSEQFRSVEDRTIRQRLTDIRDVAGRITRWLNREESASLANLKTPVILAARDIMPSQAAVLDRDLVRAVVTEKGGINSHASIIARSLNIPAVVGVANLLKIAGSARTLLVDGDRGAVIVDPGEDVIEQYQATLRERQETLTPQSGEQVSGIVETADGEPVEIYANLGQLRELESLRCYGVEGVGILRTEFLMMNREAPPSAEDYREHFSVILEFFNPRPVNIRLLDLGGDKTFPYLSHPPEPNPALGRRGVRFLLSNRNLLREQVRGILMAAHKGKPIIQIPMVTTLQEIRKVRDIIRATEEEMQIPEPVPVGIMIETPAAAILSAGFAREVDSLSIGTNDLTQYVLSSDRENEHVQEIYNSLDPSVLQLISTSVASADAVGIPMSVCGEMASDIRAIPILLGMGVRKLSVGVSRIPEVKDIVGKIPVKRAKLLARKALKAYDVIEVEKMVTRFLRKIERNR